MNTRLELLGIQPVAFSGELIDGVKPLTEAVQSGTELRAAWQSIGEEDGRHVFGFRQHVDVETTAADGTVCMRLQLVLQLVYSDSDPMTDERFESFKDTTLLLHALPFAREWVLNHSASFHVRPVLLPLGYLNKESDARKPKRKPKKQSSSS